MVYGPPGKRGKNAELGQELLSSVFSILLIEATK